MVNTNKESAKDKITGLFGGNKISDTTPEVSVISQPGTIEEKKDNETASNKDKKKKAPVRRKKPVTKIVEEKEDEHIPEAISKKLNLKSNQEGIINAKIDPELKRRMILFSSDQFAPVKSVTGLIDMAIRKYLDIEEPKLKKMHEIFEKIG